MAHSEWLASLTDPVYLRQLERDGALPQALRHLIDCQQDPDYHPEGNVFEHTVKCLIIAQKYDVPLWLRLAVLCHDLGKPYTTTVVDKEIHAYGHEKAGVEPAQTLLLDPSAPVAGVGSMHWDKIRTLIECHMIPYHLLRGKAPIRAYIRLQNRLKQHGVSMDDLVFMFTCDCYGRGISRTEQVEAFQKKVQEVAVYEMDKPPEPVVLGRHLIEKGYTPGVHFGQILDRCHHLQVVLEIDDPKQLLDIVLESGIE